MFELTESRIAPEPIVNRVKKPSNGAVVTFIGTVREYTKGKRVFYLEFDADKEIAKRKLQAMADEIQRRWQVEDIALCHRIGRTEAGETCLVVAVGAPHRREAFEACQYAVDRLKEIFREKEVREDGEFWVGRNQQLP